MKKRILSMLIRPKKISYTEFIYLVIYIIVLFIMLYANSLIRPFLYDIYLKNKVSEILGTVFYIGRAFANGLVILILAQYRTDHFKRIKLLISILYFVLFFAPVWYFLFSIRTPLIYFLSTDNVDIMGFWASLYLYEFIRMFLNRKTKNMNG